MKVAATYACGHDATFNFDGRNRFQKMKAMSYARDVASLTCPKCNRARRMAAIRAMEPDAMRKILGDLLSFSAVGEAIDCASASNG